MGITIAPPHQMIGSAARSHTPDYSESGALPARGRPILPGIIERCYMSQTVPGPRSTSADRPELCPNVCFFLSQPPTISNMSPLRLMLALVSLLGMAAAYDMSQWSTGRATHSGGEVTQITLQGKFQGHGHGKWVPARSVDCPIRVRTPIHRKCHRKWMN